ncbi:MAG: RHS repeat-associated core domain-containing protein, partial [Anaerolineae bacterium]
ESGLWSTDRRFTGQRWEPGLGLYDYRARFYDPALGRFLQPDPIVPEPGNPQALNRYGYVLNNPLRYTDPSGYAACIDDLCELVAHPATGRPILRAPAPGAIAYIHKEMVRNAQSGVAQTIAVANALSRYGGIDGVAAKMLAWSIWTSQVMDARIKDYVGPLAPLLGNWDHKPILYPKDPHQPSPVPEIKKHRGYSTVGSRLYFYDIWSNIHYGYVGRASGFSQPELTGGAGVEQIGSDLYNYKDTHQWPHQSPGTDSWLASWDQPSDNAAIQIGIRLWNQYGLAVRPADLYLAVLEEPRLATLPLGGAP